jgi:hypothetical protein
MGFIQIIELRTSKIAEMQELGNEWEKRLKADARRGGRSCAQIETTRAIA